MSDILTAERRESSAGLAPLDRETTVRSKPTTLAHRSLPLLLLQAREHVMGRFRPLLNANGITEQQWRIVRALLDAGPMEPREIGRICRISSPSLAGILARMEELAMITRQRLRHDQRRVLVSLTRRSRALAARMAPDIDGAYEELERTLGPEFVEHCYVVLDQLCTTLGGADPGDAAPRVD